MGDDLRQLKWKSTAVNLRLFFRLFDNNTLKKHKCWSAKYSSCKACLLTSID